MKRSHDRRQLTFTVVVLAVAGLLLLSFAVYENRLPFAYGPWLLLAGMALISELVPVEISRRGVRITLSLPFIAAIAVAVSPAAAILTDVVATALVGVTMMWRKKGATSGFWIGVNAATAMFSAGVASVAFLGFSEIWPDIASLGIVGGLLFILVCAATNFLSVCWLEHLTTGRGWDSVLSNLRVGALGIALYAVVGSAVCALVVENFWAFVPLTLAPIWAIRTGLAYRANMYSNYYETISALNLMLLRAHPYTHGHLERVALTAEMVARRLGLPASRARLVREAAVLHDIGKIAVDEQILDKPGKLTQEELEHVRLHSLWGAEILEPAPQFRLIADWILHHHERPDGKGYPQQLTDEAIPIESKIIAVVDAYDAMLGEMVTQRRTYRDPLSQDEALAELQRFAGTQFDRRVVAAFTEICEKGGHP